MILYYFLVIFIGVRGDASFEYYKNIWNENIEKTKQWIRPTNNFEFADYKDTNIDAGTYDFIIVGAGTSGATLASRLSKTKHWKILLIEAGGNETDFSLIPGAFFPIQLSNMNWAYLTKPQKHACYGRINRQCDYSAGKVLGGSSATNAMIFTRGNKKDFDGWKDQGNTDWSYHDVLPYFRKIENAFVPGSDPALRGRFGPVNVMLNNPIPSYAKYILGAAGEAGFTDEDYNGLNQLNVTANVQVTIKNGKRHSVNQAYLQPALMTRRRNLRVITKALGIKIIIKRLFTSKKAKGIKFIHKGRTFIAKAKKELIISAGTVNTPQLLMLSGIGLKDELVKHGIKTLVELPVGQHLEDHATIFNIVINTNLSYENQSLDDLLKQFLEGRGDLTYSNGLHIGFTKFRKGTREVPEVEYIFSQRKHFIQGEWAYKQGNYDQIMNESLVNAQPNTITVCIVLLHPKSKGWIRLNSNNPIDFPLINPKYLHNEDDMNTLLSAVEKLSQILETPTFKSINATYSKSFIKICDDLSGRDYWKCFIRYNVAGMFHPVSTCRMGSDRKVSVVDNTLLVHRFKNLRIVDASVFPNSISGHPNAVCIMIAEKIAHEIKDKYRH